MKKRILMALIILICAGVSAAASADVKIERRVLAHYISAHIDTALKGE